MGVEAVGEAGGEVAAINGNLTNLPKEIGQHAKKGRPYLLGHVSKKPPGLRGA